MHCFKSLHIHIFHYKSTVLTQENHCCIIFKWELQAFSQYSCLKYLGVQKHIQNLSKIE
uniref:Uncharacterized protein n=1 Tax=Anguilla anguilla TaxID=7936 RepID=A0A0E9XW13_ANGAN